MSRAVRTGLLSIWAVLTCPGLGAGQRLPEGVLIIPPLPADPIADSAYVVEMAQRLRDRLSPWRPDLIRTIWYCSLTDNCQALLTTDAARAQAAILLADILVVGTFERDSGAPRADLSVIEMGLRGGIPHFTASLSVHADSGVTPDGFAGIVNGFLRDTLSNVVRAARDSRGCWVGVMDEDYAGARGRAEDAFARRRNHPSAAMCLSFMFRFTQQRDSMVWALERAAEGDSMLTRAWEGLGEEYLRRGDTARAMDARTREVQSNPGNVLRRLRIAGLMDRLGRHETAVQIMRDGTRHYGSDAEFRRLLARMCLKYRMWRCALDAITERYALDSTLPGDTTIYVQAIGLAQTLSDSGAVDWWTQEAVTQVHTVVSDAWRRAERYREAAERAERVFRSFQMARAVALADAGARDSAVAMYRRVWEADPMNSAARIAAARLLTDGTSLTFESATGADSAVLVLADSLLTSAAEVSDDRAALTNVARTYLEVGSRLVQQRLMPATAELWLDKAIRYDPDGGYSTPASAFLALALLYMLEAVDRRARAEESCTLVNQETELISRARAALAVAQSEFPDLVEQALEGIESYEEVMPRMREAFGCDGYPPLESP